MKVEKEFEMGVEDMPEEGMDHGEMPEMEDEPTHNGQLPIWIGIGGGAIVLVVLSVVILKKRKAKKEKMMLDEEERFDHNECP